jgi:tetratricopeptide (TPR) repeat protein
MDRGISRGGRTMTRTLVALAMLGLLAGPARASDKGLAGTQDPQAAPAFTARALDAAIADFRAKLQSDPNDAVVHNRLGVCYQQKQQLKLARKEYEKAAELDPSYAEAWNNLGTIEHSQRKYKKAVSRYRKALALKPENATFHRNLGAAWLAAGNIPLAVSAYAEAYRLDPQSLQAGAGTGPAVLDRGQLYFVYAKIFAARGDLETAFMWLNRAREAGFRSFDRLSSDRDFAELVKDPRFEDFRH